MKKYVKRYIKFIARIISKIRFPFFIYTIALKLRQMFIKIEINKLDNCNVFKFNANDKFELIITQLEGGGVQSVIDNQIKLNPNQKYIVVFLKTYYNCEIKEYYQNTFSVINNNANLQSSLISLIGEKLCTKITIHHLRKSHILTAVNIFATKNEFNIPIYTHLHDFFFACPSFFLMDDKNKFCNLDKQKDCHKCSIIQVATSPFLNIEMNSIGQFKDINSWRKISQKLFDISSKIIAYSQTTIDMYKKTFKIPEEKIEISNALLQSSVNFQKLPQHYNLQKFDKINIAMIGSWNYVKGSEVFKEMQKIIDKDKILCKNVSLYFIGKGFCDIISRIKNLGKYNSQNLATIIQENKISICFVPSICCETFSITTQDCIAVGIPIATFGIGAMKERLLGLKNALIINEVTNENIRNFTNKEIANIAIKNILNFVQNKNNIAN